MEKMCFKSIFNWLYATVIDRAMTERQPREDRAMNHFVYRPVSVSYLSRVSLVALLLLFVGGWNSQAWGQWNSTLTATASPSEGGGVCASKEDKSSLSDSDYGSSSTSGKKYCAAFWSTATFYAYYKANPGYKFDKWSTGATSWKISVEANRSNKNPSVTAYFTPITYTIAFNGNGSTSGSTSSMSMTYGTAKNLTANGFTRAYSVTYNADGGTGAPASATATYSFAGWEDRNSIIFNGTTYAYTTFDAPYYANTYSDLYAAFGYNKYNLIQHYVNNGNSEGRSCKGATPGLYPNQASVNNMTTTDGATVTLYAQWESASITLPNATKAGSVLDGWYNGSNKVGEAGDSYTPTANVTLKAKWIDKYTPAFTGSNTDMMVGGEQTNAFSFEHVDGQKAHITVKSISTVNNGNGKVIEYDAANNKIIAHNAGVAEIYFTQGETSTIKSGTSATYTYTIYKYNSVFANVEDLNVKVDGNVSSTYTLTYTKPNADYLGEANHVAGTPALNTGSWYYTLTQNVTTGITTGSDEPTKAIVYNAESKTATGKNAGTGTIHLYQAETYKYNAADEDFIVNVTKYEPVFTWNSGNKPYYFKTKTYDIFSTTSPNNYSFESSNEFSAKAVKGVKDTLVIYNVEEDATIKVSQEENYLWSGKELEYLITPIDQENHVTFTYNVGMYNDGTITTNKVGAQGTAWTADGVRLGGSSTGITSGEAYNWDDKYVIIKFKGIPDKLSFKYKVNNSNASNMDQDVKKIRQADWYVEQSADGSNWSTIWSNLGGSNSNSESFVTVSNVQLLPSTRYLKLCYSSNFAGFYNNVVVTELNKFDADRETIDFGLQGAKYGIQVETINFTHANAGRTTNVAIEGDDAEYFEVTPNVIPGTGRDLSGTTTYRVSFDNKGERRGLDAYNAELVFSDNLGHEERVSLTGKRDGKSLPAYTFNPNNLPYYYNSTIAHIAASTNTDYANCPLTYRTTDSQIAYVDAEGYLHIGEKAGSVTITVEQKAENADFHAGSATYTFTPRERPSLSTPFVLTKDVYDNAVGHGSKCYWESNEGGRIRTGNTNIFTEDWVWIETTKLYSVEFSGAPDKITFEYKCGNSLCTPPALSAENHMWEIRESADGANWSCAWYSDTKVTSWTNSPVIQLKPETRFILFVFYGNYEGYWRNIKVTSFDGYKYLRAADGQYLSRGSSWGTRAVIDAFGIAGRVTRSTTDNTDYLMQFQFVDNGQYLFEDDAHELYTDNGARTPINWKVTNEGGLLKVQSANDVTTSHHGYYVTVREEDQTLTLTDDESQATLWHLEDYNQHAYYITQMLDLQATAAAQYDFENITTLAGVRAELRDNEYDFIEIDLPSIDEAHQQADRTSAGTAYMHENVISDLTPGFYTLSVQAFNRLAPSSQAWDIHAKGMESVVAYIYANDVKYPIKSLFDESGERLVTTTVGTDKLYPNGYYYSDNLAAAKYSFDNNAYINDVYVYVPADEGKSTGTLRYGIVNPSYVEGAWTVYGDVSLKRLTRAEFIFGGKEGNTDVWGEAGNWNRPDGRTPTDQSIVIVKQDAEISGNAAVYSLTIDAGVTLTVKNGATLTIGDSNPYPREQYGNLHVEDGGKVILKEGELRVNNFVLEASIGDMNRPASSGQVNGEETNLKVRGDAYFQICFDPVAISYGWYDFVLPFDVDVNGGIYLASDTTTPLVNNVDFAIMAFSEEKRAQNTRPWTWFSGTLKAGKLYTITLDETQPSRTTYVFKKKANAEMGAANTYNTICTTSAPATDRGWNGMGNGTLRYCQLNSDELPENAKMQIYDHTNDCYTPCEATQYTYAIGTAFFIQVQENNQTITLDTVSDSRAFRAPSRDIRTVDEFRLALTAENATCAADHLWVSASEEATGEYVIGHDLLKMGTPTSSKVAQMWTTRDNMNLCDIEMTLNANKASTSLSLYAPAAGIYTLEIEKAPEDATLYLTQNNCVIWNLSMSPYDFDLTKGTTEGYGLRIVAQTPQVATDFEQSEFSDQPSVRKVLIDNVLYIVTPEGKMYDIVGKGIKF